jgi:hypothetical protein
LPSLTSSLSAQGLLDRGDRVRRVQLVQIQVVGAQPAQRCLHRAADVGPAALGPGRRAVIHVYPLLAELGGQHHLVPAPREHLAEDLSRSPAVAIGVRGVDQRDARIHGRVDHSPGARHVQPAAEVVAAQADHGNEQPAVTQ